MCPRSDWRVMLWDTLVKAAWQSSFILCHMAYWPLLPSLVWHHWHKFCLFIWSWYWFLHSHFTVICKTMSSWLVVKPYELQSRTFAWSVWLLYMHRHIIVAHTLVNELSKKLTCSKIGARIVSQGDTRLEIQTFGSIPALTQMLSPCLCQN